MVAAPVSDPMNDLLQQAAPSGARRLDLGPAAPLVVAVGFALVLLAGAGFLLPDTVEAYAKGLSPFWSIVCQ
ncbi:MAG: hypothetical protein U1E97_11455 [Alphaproteobacteria bacterium]